MEVDPSWELAIGHKVLILADGGTLRAAAELAGVTSSGVWGSQQLRAGEHLAAICLMAFLRCSAPVAFDTAGEVDLLFGPLAESVLSIPAGVRVAFEVKSAAGGYREWDAAVDRAAPLPVDSPLRSREIRWESAASLENQLNAAVAALARKT